MKEVTQKLIKKRATPTEMKIYAIALHLTKKNGFFENHDMREAYAPPGGEASGRTNIRQHLTRMMEKGLIKKLAYHRYAAVEIIRN